MRPVAPPPACSSNSHTATYKSLGGSSAGELHRLVQDNSPAAYYSCGIIIRNLDNPASCSALSPSAGSSLSPAEQDSSSGKSSPYAAGTSTLHSGLAPPSCSASDRRFTVCLSDLWSIWLIWSAGLIDQTSRFNWFDLINYYCISIDLLWLIWSINQSNRSYHILR